MSTQKFKAGDVIKYKKEQKDDYFPSHLLNRDLVVKRVTDQFVYFDIFPKMKDGWLHARFEYAFKQEAKQQKNHAWAIVDKADTVRYITTTRKLARELKAMLSTRYLKIRKIEFSFTDQKDKS